MDLYLKFSDEAAAKAALYDKTRPSRWAFDTQEVDVWVYQTAYGEHAFQTEFTPEECAEYGYTFIRKDKEFVRVDQNPDEGEWEFVPKFRNIDTIGVIMKRTGGTDEEPVMTAVPGWHVNVRALADEDVSGLEAFVTNPATPVRVWG